MDNPKSFWNQRYAKASFVYGTQPNEWFASCINQLPPGTILLPAEGEGRNAVYAASLGWDAYCLDFSTSAKTKALNLAKQKKVTLHRYDILDLEKLTASDFEIQFDAIGLCFVHAPDTWRRSFHHEMIQLLKPGGHLILEAFDKSQLGKKSGGPKNELQLFLKDDLEIDFKSLEIRIIEQKTVLLKEGKGHRGEANVIRIWAQKALVKTEREN